MVLYADVDDVSHCRLKGDTTLHNAWMQAGLLSMTAFTVLCIVSLRPIRAVGYEFFFVAHFILVLCVALLFVIYISLNLAQDHAAWRIFPCD